MCKIRSSLIILAILWGFQPGSTSAQDTYREGWLSLGVSYDLSKRLTARADSEVRLDETDRSVDQVFGEVGMQWDVLTFARLGTFYRLSHHPNRPEMDVRHRVYGDLTLSMELGRVELSNRSRYQVQAGEIQVFSNDDAETFFRDRVQIEWDIRKSRFRPAGSVELFLLDDSDDGWTRRKIRYTAGTDVSTSRKNRISLFIRMERELERKNPDDTWIIGIGYRFRK